MSFWSRALNGQLRAAVRINFYGSEDAASVELAPEPASEDAMLLHITLFLSYYVRTLCDLRPEQLEGLKSFMEMAGRDIFALEQDKSSAKNISILGSRLRLQPASTFGITRTHACELYERANGGIFPQSTWSPMGIGTYGPFSTIYYYQSLLDRLSKGGGSFLASRITNIHKYLLATGGRPSITQIGEAVKSALMD